ncbi:MAG: metal-dependent hydrolase [Candidatus Hodarchaeales archaeon]|jgi:hypothetical protein
MCQGAHALEAVLVRKYFRKGVLSWMVLGQIAPDLITKVWIFESDNAWETQKLPPLGLTHTPFLHLLIGIIIFLIIREKDAAFSKSSSYAVGAITHILMDAGDPYGVMLYYPLSENLFKWKQIIGFDFWAYGNQYSGAVDARMYFMSWGLLIELFFLLSVLPILPSALSREEFSNPIEYIFSFTFVWYGASLFLILTLTPVLLGVPVPQDYNPDFKWGNVSTFSGNVPESAINAQWILAFIMGSAFLLCFLVACFFAIQYYDQNTWPSRLRQYVPIVAEFMTIQIEETS